MEQKRVLRVEELRKDADISKYRLHKISGVSWDRVNRLCTEVTMPPDTKYRTLRGIADALGVGIDDLEGVVDE